MRRFFKDRKTFLIFVIVTILSVIVRFGDYSRLVNFSLDPPVHITEARNIVESGRINLVGPPITSKEVMGRVIFLGPFYYYFLEVLGVITHWNVYLISIVFTSVWLLTGVVIFAILYKNFDSYISLLFYALTSFIPGFVVFSRQIWNLQFIPLFASLFLYFLLKRQKKINIFISGFFLGLGLNVHYASVFWALAVLPFIVSDIRSKKFRFMEWMLFPLGVVIAELPMVLFEFRHDFYNIRTILFHIQYAEISAGYKFGLWYYYVLPLFPFAVYLAAKMIYEVKNMNVYKISTTLILLVSFFLFFDAASFRGRETLHPPGWTINKQKIVANIIAGEAETDFEVAQTISSDTRSIDIRWWLEGMNVSVMDVKSYPDAKILYLVTTEARPPHTEGVWEVASFKPFEVEYKKDLGEGLLLYKLKGK